ncbi:MAG: branched-chain amino acid ABC transporter permease [bacterium]
MLLAAAVAAPFWLNKTQPYYLQLAINVLIFAVLALSWDLLARTGQLSLAHAAFFGLGAYTSALMTTRAGVPIPVGIALGSVVATVTAAALGFLTLRLRGIYFAIATLAFSETLRVITKQLRFTGGPAGTVAPPLLAGNLPGQYLVILGILLLAVVVSHRVNHSRWHFAFTAIRTNEEVAAVMGVDVVRFKVAAFALSALFAGITGGFYAHVFLFINPFEAYSLAISVGALVAPIFGGLYTTLGPLLGAVALRIGEEALRAALGSGFLIIYGLILAAVILYMPRGLLGLWTAVVARRQPSAPRAAGASGSGRP